LPTTQETTIPPDINNNPCRLLILQRLQKYWSTAQEPQVPLTFLQGTIVWRAGISRDSIINAVGNVQTIKAISHKAYRKGRQNSIQAKNVTALHRAQVQRLAALANEHAHLCYEFENQELLIHNIHWTKDPTSRRALQGCRNELHQAGLLILSIDPAVNCPPALAIIRKWYSPGFTCS
jgi:hypothetical protein